MNSFLITAMIRESITCNSPVNSFYCLHWGRGNCCCMAEVHPSTAELQAPFKDWVWDDPVAKAIIANIKFPDLPAGFIPQHINTFVELGEKNMLTGERVIKRDAKGRPVTMKITPEFYMRWKDRVLKQLGIATGNQPGFYLDMRKKEKFFVKKAEKSAGMVTDLCLSYIDRRWKDYESDEEDSSKRRTCRVGH